MVLMVFMVLMVLGSRKNDEKVAQKNKKNDHYKGQVRFITLYPRKTITCTICSFLQIIEVHFSKGPIMWITKSYNLTKNIAY